MAKGKSGNVTITTTAQNGFYSAIALSASGVPSNVTASFNPTSIGAPGTGTSTLKLTVSSRASTGTHTITITGTGEGKTNNTTLSLTVVSSKHEIVAARGSLLAAVNLSK